MKIKILFKKVKEKAWALIISIVTVLMSSYTVYALTQRIKEMFNFKD